MTKEVLKEIILAFLDNEKEIFEDLRKIIKTDTAKIFETRIEVIEELKNDLDKYDSYLESVAELKNLKENQNKRGKKKE